jgi:hypothetical protein
VLDKERLKNGSFFNKAYFENLLAEIREIRASERKFYQKITDSISRGVKQQASVVSERAGVEPVSSLLILPTHTGPDEADCDP